MRLLRQLKQGRGLTYDELAAEANMARNTVINYITKPDRRRDTRTLKQLLSALAAPEDDRATVLQLYLRTQPAEVGPAEVVWLEQARPANCRVWPMAEFTAVDATVHTAIGRRRLADRDEVLAADLTPPAYVSRAHDPALRHDIEQAAAGRLHGLIAMRGTSSTGKTRSLFEAVRLICPDWTVIRPLGGAAARGLPGSGLLDRPVVVWLNELQGFLGPNGTGLSVHVLADLHAAASGPVVLVGTLWPDKLHTVTDPRDDTRSETRELLAEATRWVRWHDVASTLTTDTERSVARELAEADPRLAAAVADPDRVGSPRPWPVRTSRSSTTAPPAGLLIDAAADARRLGHTSALTAELLQATAQVLWDDHTPPPWPPASGSQTHFATPPGHCAPTVSAPFIPIEDAGRIGYDLADYLEQNLTRNRRTRPSRSNLASPDPTHSPP